MWNIDYMEQKIHELEVFLWGSQPITSRVNSYVTCEPDQLGGSWDFLSLKLEPLQVGLLVGCYTEIDVARVAENVVGKQIGNDKMETMTETKLLDFNPN